MMKLDKKLWDFYASCVWVCLGYLNSNDFDEQTCLINDEIIYSLRWKLVWNTTKKILSIFNFIWYSNSLSPTHWYLQSKQHGPCLTVRATWYFFVLQNKNTKHKYEFTNHIDAIELKLIQIKGISLVTQTFPRTALSVTRFSDSC